MVSIVVSSRPIKLRVRLSKLLCEPVLTLVFCGVGANSKSELKPHSVDVSVTSLYVSVPFLISLSSPTGSNVRSFVLLPKKVLSSLPPYSVSLVSCPSYVVEVFSIPAYSRSSFSSPLFVSLSFSVPVYSRSSFSSPLFVSLSFSVPV